jgi:hypothetical protein
MDRIEKKVKEDNFIGRFPRLLIVMPRRGDDRIQKKKAEKVEQDSFICFK